ncbi:hypothetical protein Zmor_015498 [Zophobas morio]|uniref:Peptidase S1 domain-containing protein n=1 Tax=Zophobas morio TaxID=2755281 RepID=A0AA38IJ87_9CUCU|nr:hypothetical protein Zmor_015498 [Zophobas morio]
MKVVFGFLLLIFVVDPSKEAGRIIGGQDAYAGQFSFAAAIYTTTQNSRFFCGGSLIGPEWILTAGQCVNGAISFTIHLGSNVLEGNDPNRLILASSDYVLHPEFDPNTLVNDVGLIKLRMAISYTEYIQKVFMAYGDLNDYTNLVALGWGQTSDSVAALSNELQYVSVVAVSNAECRVVYGNQISDQMVCVAGAYNEGTCTGDSGSPLVHYDSVSKSIRHVGISTFISGNGCESLDPSGYTRTYSYKSWITNVTGIIT